MMNVREMLDLIEEAGFSIHEYPEDGSLCRYEIETWTDDLEIDMISFLDLRTSKYADGITPENIALELRDIYNRFDVDEETVIHWKAYEELRHAGITRIAQDFESYEKRLETLCIKAAAWRAGPKPQT